MPVTELRLIKRCAEFCEKDKKSCIPDNTRGIYVLFNRRRLLHPRMKKIEDRFDVVYIGMARGERSGARGRLYEHARSDKQGKWTHFSLFEVHDNIFGEEIVELEGLFRHIYRKDAGANPLNAQKGFAKLNRAGKVKLEDWGKKDA